MLELLVLSIGVAFTLPQDAAPPTVVAAELRITDSQGGPVQFARVQLLEAPAAPKRVPDTRSWPAARTWSPAPSHPARNLEPRDFPGDYARFEDLPAGRYVFLVEDAHHVPTPSEAFEVPAATAPQITVRLQRGATIDGVVTDPTGKPLAGVEVRAEHPSALSPGHPFAAMFAAIRAQYAPALAVRTAADGTFRIPRVAPGEYRIVASNYAFAPNAATVTVAAGERKKLPALALHEGVVVAGTVTRDGKPVEGAEVVLQTDLLGGSADAVLLVAISDAQGVYTIPVRVRAGGRYAVMASESKGKDAMERAAQVQATRRMIEAKTATQPQIEDLKF